MKPGLMLNLVAQYLHSQLSDWRLCGRMGFETSDAPARIGSHLSYLRSGCRGCIVSCPKQPGGIDRDTRCPPHGYGILLFELRHYGQGPDPGAVREPAVERAPVPRISVGLPAGHCFLQ